MEGGFTTLGGVPSAGESMGEVENKVVGGLEGRLGDGGVDSGDVEVGGGLRADGCCETDPYGMGAGGVGLMPGAAVDAAGLMLVGTLGTALGKATVGLRL